MKSRKYIFFVLCAVFALGAMTFAFTGCSEQESIEFGEWVTMTSPTCEGEGVEMRVSLNDPNVTETRAIPANGHDWNAWVTKTEPTCLLAGVETRSCNTCENSDMRAIPALGHSWGEWETLLASTCQSGGSQKRVCTRDEAHTELQATPALGHDFSDWVMTLAPTCTVSGVETRYCRNCNDHTEVRAVEALGHNWSSSVVTKTATCTEAGEKTSVCSNDATHTIITTISATGHAYGDWVIKDAPTESTDGAEMRVCRNNASHIDTRVVPALGSLDKLTLGVTNNGSSYIAWAKNRSISGTIYIPAVYNGLPVTQIGDNGFVSCANIENVVFLGNNIERIGNNAFINCGKLQSIEIPEGVTRMGPNCFAKCTSLESVAFPSTLISIDRPYQLFSVNLMSVAKKVKSLTVAEGNPVYKSENNCLIERATNKLLLGLSNSVIPDNVTEIADYAFRYTDIESVNIPASVETIGANVFYNCANLKEVTFEEGNLTEICQNAFYNCTSLECIELPDSLITISEYAFYMCESLKKVAFGSHLEQIERYAFYGCTDLTVSEIPASVKLIGPRAFGENTIKSLTVAEDNQYYRMDSGCLVEIETKILLAGTADATIPDYIEYIGGYSFFKTDIKNVVIPKSVIGIYASAFRNCKLLSSVTFEKDSALENIGENAFSGSAIKSIILPAKLKKIWAGAFENCTSLTSVTFEQPSENDNPESATGLEIIEVSAFANTALTTFEIPATVKEINPNAFLNTSVSLTVEEGNTTYRVETGCLIEIATQKVVLTFGTATIPQSAKAIGAYALRQCTNATIVIPSNVETVDEYALYGLTSERTVKIKGVSSKEEADELWGRNWNYGCKATIVYEG